VLVVLCCEKRESYEGGHSIAVDDHHLIVLRRVGFVGSFRCRGSSLSASDRKLSGVAGLTRPVESHNE
jgi:hypothetical protein